MKNQSKKIVEEFLAMFYYHQLSFPVANLSSLEYLEKFPEYKDELSEAFYYVFESSDPEISFRDLAKNYANRLSNDETSAREFIYEIFLRNVLDLRTEEPVMSEIRPTKII